MTEAAATRTEELSREESMRLLQEHSFVGRVAFLLDGRIMILPVNYLGSDDGVVFCTAPGSKLDALQQGAQVAFEVDSSRSLSSPWGQLTLGNY